MHALAFGDFHLGFFGVGAVFFGRALLACVGLERIPFLGPRSESAPREPIDVILIARGPIAGVATCVEALLDQQDVDLRVIVVDDRSDAATTRAVAALAGERVEAIRIDAVPADALPFPHALRVALGATRSERVLVLQEAVQPLRRDSVAALLHAARVQRAASLWVLPRPRPGALWPLVLAGIADALPALAAIHRGGESLAVPIDVAVHRSDLLRVALARPDAKAAAVPELLIADTCRRRGLAVRVAQGSDEFAALRRLRLADLLETSERALASVGLRPWLLVLVTALYALACGTAVYGAFADNPWGWFAAGGLCSAAIPGVLIARVMRAPLLLGLLAPLSAPIEVLSLAFTSARLAVRRGVRWRGVFVPLAILRRAPSLGDGAPDTEE